jgi:hypothetical protein
MITKASHLLYLFGLEAFGPALGFQCGTCNDYFVGPDIGWRGPAAPVDGSVRCVGCHMDHVEYWLPGLPSSIRYLVTMRTGDHRGAECAGGYPGQRTPL